MNTSHSVSMLETMRSASLCVKLSTSINNTSTTSTTVKRSTSDVASAEETNMTGARISVSEGEWRDNRESCSEDDDDLNDYDVDDSCQNVSYKDLFRMATLGGATGIFIHSFVRSL